MFNRFWSFFHISHIPAIIVKGALYVIAMVLVPLLAGVSMGQTQGQSTAPFSPVDEKTYVGNVYGNVVDSETGKPLSGVEIILSTSAVTRTTKKSADAIATDGGYVVLPKDLNSSKLRTITDGNGDFLINSIPTPYPEKPYTIMVSLPGFIAQVLNQIPVRPGAAMALRLSISLTPGFGTVKVFEKQDQNAPFNYRDDEPKDIPTVELDKNQTAVAGGGGSSRETRQIFATREGLVGLTTANGHVIQPNDRFVALPSRLFLAKNWSYDFQVKLTYKGRVIYAPVWDVGPHNTSDDYWNPSGIRAMWRNLAQGLPEAQAAYQSGYNGGKDDRGRKVKNPAGIDLADGTFLNDLKMTNNDWITVEYQWTGGNADFGVSKSPDITWIVQGSSASFQVTVQSLDGFKSPVNISVSGLPKGASASSATVQPLLNGWTTATVSVSTSKSTPTGTFRLTFEATCGTVTRKTSAATLIVNPPPPPPGQVTVNATLNGRTWSGSVKYSVSGPSGVLIGRAAPGTTKDLTPGRYTIGSISGGPGLLWSVGPNTTQTLNPSGAITFTLNFKK